MVLGYRGKAKWRDMSDYVVHFTKDTDDGNAYDAMKAILAGGTIEARNAFGCATNISGLGNTQSSACLSEIPLDMLDRLVSRRSQFGIGFHQQVLFDRGGGRVWYLDEKTPQQQAFRDMVRVEMTGGVDLQAGIWRVTPFVDYPRPSYHFEWEREWRVPGGLPFNPTDVSFLFVPARLHRNAADFLVDLAHDSGGDAFTCPILDPLWSDRQIQKALRAL